MESRIEKSLEDIQVEAISHINSLIKRVNEYARTNLENVSKNLNGQQDDIRKIGNAIYLNLFNERNLKDANSITISLLDPIISKNIRPDRISPDRITAICKEIEKILNDMRFKEIKKIPTGTRFGGWFNRRNPQKEESLQDPQKQKEESLQDIIKKYLNSLMESQTENKMKERISYFMPDRVLESNSREIKNLSLDVIFTLDKKPHSLTRGDAGILRKMENFEFITTKYTDDKCKGSDCRDAKESNEDEILNRFQILQCLRNADILNKEKAALAENQRLLNDREKIIERIAALEKTLLKLNQQEGKAALEKNKEGKAALEKSLLKLNSLLEQLNKEHEALAKSQRIPDILNKKTLEDISKWRWNAKVAFSSHTHWRSMKAVEVLQAFNTVPSILAEEFDFINDKINDQAFKELISLQQHVNILDEENFEIIKSKLLAHYGEYENKLGLTGLFIDISTAHSRCVGLSITPEDFRLLITHNEPEFLLRCFTQLYYCGLGNNQENRNAIARFDNFGLFSSMPSYVMHDIVPHNLITQDLFNRIIQHSNILLTETIKTILSRVPRHLMEETAFYSQICDVCDQANGNVENAYNSLRVYVDRVIGLGYLPQPQQPQPQQPQQPQPLGGINYNQSTHNEEVHKSVSESATRLKAKYGEQINSRNKLNNVIADIVKWAKTLPEKDPLNLQSSQFNYLDENTRLLIVEPLQTVNEKNQSEQKRYVSLESKKAAARRAILERGVLDLEFTDPGSGVTMKEMFALYWLAIQDNKERVGNVTVDAARDLFAEMLYQTQREYGFVEYPKDSEIFYDKGGKDKPSCSGGTFNKPPEIFCSVLPNLVELRMMNETMAGLAVKSYTKTYTKEYLEELKKTMNPKEFNALLDQAKNQRIGLDAKVTVGSEVKTLWDGIEKKVHQAMRKYLPVFDNNENSLNDFIEEYGKDTPPDAKLLEKLRPEAVPASQGGLFANSSNTTNTTTADAKSKQADDVKPEAENIKSSNTGMYSSNS